jgi:hypothetical protein
MLRVIWKDHSLLRSKILRVCDLLFFIYSGVCFDFVVYSGVEVMSRLKSTVAQ